MRLFREPESNNLRRFDCYDTHPLDSNKTVFGYYSNASNYGDVMRVKWKHFIVLN